MCRVLCLVLTPPACPSSRYTVYNLLPYMQDYGVDVDVHPFYSPNAYEKILRSPSALEKTIIIIWGYLNLIAYLRKVPRVDVVWIHRFVAPVGTGFIAFMLKKVLRKPLVFGYDDAVYVNRKKGNIIREWFGSWRDIEKLIVMGDYVLARNPVLGSYAQARNPNVLVLPSAIEAKLYNRQVNKSSKAKRNNKVFVLGWIGSSSSAPYLELIRSVLEKLGQECLVEFRLIGGDMPDIDGVIIKRIPWRQSTEIEELCQVDVGIATLPDDEWARGKSGLKVVQYMGCGLPVVASAVGSHLDLLEHGKQGFLVKTEIEWLDALRALRDNQELRIKMGESGRRQVLLKHDFPIIAKSTAEVFRKLCKNEQAFTCE